jgi:hypothetical protein
MFNSEAVWLSAHILLLRVQFYFPVQMSMDSDQLDMLVFLLRNPMPNATSTSVTFSQMME